MRRLTSLLCALSLWAAAGVASATSFNIALLSAMGNNSFDNDVIAKIQADAPFLNITVITVDLVTPDVATLEGYQAILLMSNNAFANAVTLGDNLKQYIDHGHGLVVAGNANSLTNCTNATLYQICGGYHSSDYWAIEPGLQQSSSNLTLGTIYVPASPLLTGVTSFNGGSLSIRIAGSVNGNATLVADWSNGTPLIVTRTFASGAKEVALNFFPPSADAYAGLWLAGTDGGRMLSNALIYAGDIPLTEAVPEPSYFVAAAGLAVVALLIRRQR